MSIARFFCVELDGQVIELAGAEAHHLLNVRRVRPGEEVELFDGKGHLLRGRLKNTLKKTATIEVLKRYTKPPPELEIVLACAMAKGSRWNWLLEKCVELGAARISPTIFKRSVVKGSPEQLSKWNSRCVEAAKQCGQAYLPQISKPTGLQKILDQTKDDCLALVGTLDKSAQPILSALKKSKRPQHLLLLIGPEGGLTAQEQTLAKQRGYLPVFLTENTLRVETAAIGLLAAVRAWIDDEKSNMKDQK